jgi:chromosome partitioning protein
LRESVGALRDAGFDVVLIDTAPSLGVSMAAALCCGDFVLSPIQLEAYSIQGIKKMVLTISNIRKVNPGLVFLGMMPSMVDSRNPRHKRHLVELEEAYPQLMIPAQIGLRSSVADALASRVPVWKIRKTAARAATKEIRNLANFIFDKVSASDLDIQRRIA